MKKLNLFYIILATSIILPIIAYKVKAPSFLSNSELRIAQFQEPTISEFRENRSLLKLTLVDPFKIDLKQRVSSSEKSKDSLISAQISLIYSGKNKYVMIEDRIFKEGDKFDSFTIKKISQDRVLLKDKKGEEIWLKL